MRAKSVNEQNFEKGLNPKRAMGIGIRDYEDYVKFKLQQKYPNKDLNKLQELFYEMVGEGFEEMKGHEISEMILDLLKHAPLEYQKEYMEGDIEMFEEGVEEGWIEI